MRVCADGSGSEKASCLREIAEECRNRPIRGMTHAEANHIITQRDAQRDSSMSHLRPAPKLAANPS